jgi:ABC-type cobalamin transport system ATPase subunit
MMRILTGIQSTNVPHLGNILGAIIPAIELSKNPTSESLLFIADMHTLTSVKDAAFIKQSTLSVAATWLAFGVNTNKTVFYRQSRVPQVTELTWYLNCFTPYPMLANAHSFIENKEVGYMTRVGDRGSKLSGGERQRVTIARAVLKNPPIMILDEATSSLDTESEKWVQDAINNMMQNRTSIVIAHRLSTIRHADEIIVLQKGSIVERGNHDTLLAQNGYYRKLIEMQEVK